MESSREMTCHLNVKFMAIENLVFCPIDLCQVLVEVTFCRLIFFLVINYDRKSLTSLSCHYTVGKYMNISDAVRQCKSILVIDKE